MELAKFLASLLIFLPLTCGTPTAALRRDIEQAREIQATEVIEKLRTSAGNSFGGAWLDNGKLNIAVTNKALFSEIIAAGANPVIVSAPLFKLEEAQKKIDQIHLEQQQYSINAATGTGIATWFVDVATNKLVLEALSSSTTQAQELAKHAGLVESDFEVRTVSEMPIPFATVRGGDTFLVNGTTRCTVGFCVTARSAPGFITSGHCGRVGDTATTPGGVVIGTFGGSVYPGSGDYAFVRGTSGNTYSGTIGNGGQNIPISGSTEAGIGASVCRSGSTTGVFCGTIRAKNVSVNYAEGTVTGLTATTVCSEPGGSGTPYYSGSQAQGILSGGSGNCQSGGTSFFQPVNEILAAYGLTLIRG